MKTRRFVLPVLLCLGFAVLTLQCGGGGGSGSSSSGGGGGNGGGGTVSLTSLNPIVAMQNGAAFTLTVNGSGFVSGDQVVFNGSAITPASVSPTQLMAQIPSSALASAGTFNVNVKGASNSPSPLSFYVVPQLSPAPVTVSAGVAASGVNIQVASLTPTLQLQSIGGCVCPTETTAGVSEVTVSPGQTVNLFVVGNGMVAGTFYVVTGGGITVTQPLATDFTQTTSPVTPAVNFNITISSGATSGPRNLMVINPAGEISVYPGAILVSGS
jgi:hypothetical protein